MDCFKTKKGNSIIRAFHASPNSPEIDIYIDGELKFNNLPYTNFSEYSYLPKGSHTLQITPANNLSKILVNKVIDIPEDKIFTIASINNLDKLDPLLIEDDINQIPSPKESIFRVINLAPNVSSTDLLSNDNTLFEGIDFKKNTNYIKVPTGEYNLNFSLPSTKDTLLSTKVNFKPNRIYTLFLTGNTPELGLIQSVDVNSFLCR